MPPWSMPSLFNNNVTIVGTEELQISNGSFVTKATQQPFAYINYTSFLYDSVNVQTLDYSGINNSGYRYANFIWKFDNIANSSYSKLAFTISGMSGVELNNSIYYCSGTTTPINIYYRIIDSAYTVPGSGPSAYSTSWINANSLDTAGGLNSRVTGSNYSNNNGVGSAVNLFSQETPIPSLSNSTGLINVFIPQTNFSDSTNTVYVVFRLGLPMDKNVSFTTVQATVKT